MLDVVAERKSVDAVPRHLPRRSVVPLVFGYFFVSLAIVVAGIFALDRWIIPSLENSGQLESYLWADENHKLNHFTYLKNEARKTDAVWRSQYLPVTAEHAGKKRIMVVGDSFVWGDGSNNVNDLWWRQLDCELKRRGYNDVEVIAAGLNGASTREESGWLHSLLPKYKPDLVVLGYVTNDPDEKQADGRPYVRMLSKELKDDDFLLSKLNGLLPNLTGQLRQIRKLARQAQVSEKSGALEYADWELAILTGDNFKAYDKTVTDLAAYLKAAHVPAFIVALPAGFQNKTKENTASQGNFFESVRAYNSCRFEKVKPVFAHHGLNFVDTAKDFAEAASQDPLLKSSNSALRLGINPGNGHPGPFSTHFYAVSAANTIEHDFPAVLSEKTGISKPAAVAINDCMPPYMNARADEKSPGSFDFTYPPDQSEHTLYMPLRRRHVQLSLAEPVAVQKIEITGVNLSAAQIYLSFFDDRLGYAPGTFSELPLKKGNRLSWNIPGSSKLNALKLRARFQGVNQSLKIRFYPAH